MGLSAIFGALGNAANQVAPVAQGLGGLLNAFRGNRGADKAFSQSQLPTAAEQEVSILIDALSNPESARYKATYDTQYKQGVDAFLRQLQMINQASNRQMSRGLRPTFFNPERADETINYLTTRGLPNVASQAQESSRRNLATLADAQAGLIPMQKQRQASAYDYAQRTEANRQANPLGGFGDILRLLQGFGGKSDEQKVNDFIKTNPLPPINRRFG
jgi:hypothetical protein